MMRKIKLPIALTFLSFLASCSTDSYDKGEGPYSKMHNDFAELSIDTQKQGVSFLTDDGERYTLNQPFAAKWIETADTIYRILIYYNKVEDHTAELLDVGRMLTLIPQQPSDIEEERQDPVGLESIWIAKNKRYMNIGLLLKNGRDENGEEGRHKLNIVCDEVRLNPDQTRTAYYRLLHDQGETPQYYTNRRYISVLLPDELPDSVRLSIQTYDGTIEKNFEL